MFFDHHPDGKDEKSQNFRSNYTKGGSLFLQLSGFVALNSNQFVTLPFIFHSAYEMASDSNDEL